MEGFPSDRKVAADLCFSSPEVISTSVASQEERKAGRKGGIKFKINLLRKKGISILMPQVAMRGLPLTSAHHIALTHE